MHVYLHWKTPDTRKGLCWKLKIANVGNASELCELLKH